MNSANEHTKHISVVRTDCLSCRKVDSIFITLQNWHSISKLTKSRHHRRRSRRYCGREEKPIANGFCWDPWCIKCTYQYCGHSAACSFTSASLTLNPEVLKSSVACASEDKSRTTILGKQLRMRYLMTRGQKLYCWRGVEMLSVRYSR